MTRAAASTTTSAPRATPFAPACAASSSARSRRTSTPGTRPSAFPRELYAKAADAGLLGLGYPEHLGGTPAAMRLAPDRHRGGRARRQRRPAGEPVLACHRPAADRRPRQRRAAAARRSRRARRTQDRRARDHRARRRLRRRAHRLPRPPRRRRVGRSTARRPSSPRACAPTGSPSPCAPAARARAASRCSRCPAMRPASSARRWPRWAGGAATPRACRFAGCRVPGDHLIGDENAGFRVDHGQLQRRAAADGGRARAPSPPSAIDEALAWARQRKTFGADARRAPGRPPQADGHAHAHLQPRSAWIEALVDRYDAGAARRPTASPSSAC